MIRAVRSAPRPPPQPPTSPKTSGPEIGSNLLYSIKGPSQNSYCSTSASFAVIPATWASR